MRNALLLLSAFWIIGKCQTLAQIRVESWLDNDYSQHVTTATHNDTIAELSVDMKLIKSGLHFINVLPIRANGEPGVLLRSIFYLTEPQPTSTPTETCQIWLDNDPETMIETGLENLTSAPYPLDISHLAPGLHYFNLLPCGDDGKACGTLTRTLFYIHQKEIADLRTEWLEYWIDGDYAHRMLAKSGHQEDIITADLSNVAPGLHYFNLRSIGEHHTYGAVYRSLFFLTEPVLTDLTGYEYWIDDLDRITVNAAPGASIELEIDISTLSEGDHTFSYRFRNSNGKWGSEITETFTVADQLNFPTTGIPEASTEKDGLYDVYTLSGICLVHRATADQLKEALPSLQPGFYIIGGKKVLLK